MGETAHSTHAYGAGVVAVLQVHEAGENLQDHVAAGPLPGHDDPAGGNSCGVVVAQSTCVFTSLVFSLFFFVVSSVSYGVFGRWLVVLGLVGNSWSGGLVVLGLVGI